MGAVAATVADAVMITTDNPRREDPAAIAEQIAVGCASVDGADWQIELDRERAFDETLRAAISGDTVLLAGKGHETYQEINDLVQPFDDRAMARSILQTLKEAR
jgi:UDP-N-acetylmuramoyl-L-alanyl-D-glutamate--2,6-diaminopimelate ligase